MRGWSNTHHDDVEDYKRSRNYNVKGLENQTMVDIYATLINCMTLPTVQAWWGECYEGKAPGKKKEAIRDIADFLANIRE